MLTLAVSYDQEEKVEGKEKHKTKKETHCCASRSDVFHLTPSFFYRLMFHSFQSKRANQHGAKEITVTCKEKKKLGLGWLFLDAPWVPGASLGIGVQFSVKP